MNRSGGQGPGRPDALPGDPLDALLDSWTAPPVRPDLRRRLASIPALEPRPAHPLRRLLGPWLAAGGLAAATALGGIAGVSTLGEEIAQAVGIETVPEDELVAMLDAVMEEALQ